MYICDQPLSLTLSNLIIRVYMHAHRFNKNAIARHSLLCIQPRPLPVILVQNLLSQNKQETISIQRVCSWSWSLLLSCVQSPQWHVSDLHHLESYTCKMTKLMDMKILLLHSHWLCVVCVCVRVCGELLPTPPPSLCHPKLTVLTGDIPHSVAFSSKSSN